MSSDQKQNAPATSRPSTPTSTNNDRSPGPAAPNVVASTTTPAAIQQAVQAAPPASPMPQAVQVIQQPIHSPPYISQFPYNQQQQLMLHNAAAVQMQAAMSAAQFNMAAMAAAAAARTPTVSPKSPGFFFPNPTSQVIFQQTNSPTSMGQATNVASTTGTVPNSNVANANKPVVNGNKQQAQQAQIPAAAMMGAKPIMPAQPVSTPLVLSQIGVMPGQVSNSGNFVTQAKGQTYTVSQAGQPQMINTQAQIRLSSQPQLVNNTGQIITSQPIMTNQAVLQAMANLQQGMPFGNQPFMASHNQSPAILAAAPSLYIRPANPIQPQQGIMNAASMQAATVPQPKVGKQEVAQTVQAKTVMGEAQGKVAGIIQPGKTILPGKKTASVTAKVQPTTVTPQGTAKLNIPSVMPRAPRPKGRPKGTGKSALVAAAAVSASAVVSSAQITTLTSTTVASSVKTTPNTVSQSKPATPITQVPIAQVAPKSQSDSELETAKKTSTQNTVLITKNDTIELKCKSEATDDKPEKPVAVAVTVNGNGLTVTNGVDGSDSEKSREPMDTMEKSVVLETPPVVVEKQKAIVKPHILTHYIEGFVIQEGPEPFPVQRSSLLTEFVPPKPSQSEEMGPPLLDHPMPPVLEPHPVAPYRPDDPNRSPKQMQVGSNTEGQVLLKCEFCGKMAAKFRRSKRFCSMVCAKRYNVSRKSPHKPKVQPPDADNLSPPVLEQERPIKQKKPMKIAGHLRKKKSSVMKRGIKAVRGKRMPYNMGSRPLPPPTLQPINQESEERSTSPSSHDSSSSPESQESPAEFNDYEMKVETTLRTSPSKWNVNEVFEFIKTMPGCEPYADEFKSQEIDGQALLLLKEDHLMTAMNMKLGPALKICARINSLKEENL